MCVQGVCLVDLDASTQPNKRVQTKSTKGAHNKSGGFDTFAPQELPTKPRVCTHGSSRQKVHNKSSCGRNIEDLHFLDTRRVLPHFISNFWLPHYHYHTSCKEPEEETKVTKEPEEETKMTKEPKVPEEETKVTKEPKVPEEEPEEFNTPSKTPSKTRSW